MLDQGLSTNRENLNEFSDKKERVDQKIDDLMFEKKAAEEDKGKIDKDLKETKQKLSAKKTELKNETKAKKEKETQARKC